MALWLCLPGCHPYELRPGVDVTIGRGGTCEISLYSTLLSREHARVRWEREDPVFFDLDSLNGCFVGLDRITRHPLGDGVVIRLGDVHLLFREADHPPLNESAQVEEPTRRGGSVFEEGESGETQLFARTPTGEATFAYDELKWLESRLKKDAKQILDGRLESDLPAWLAAQGDAELFWKLLRLGVLMPRELGEALDTSSAEALAPQLVLARRGSGLREVFAGEESSYNEMGFLRCEVKLRPVFQGLFQVARAYRPGGGLMELDLSDVIYELRQVYASGLSDDELSHELRVLLGLGVLCPNLYTRSEAWYPADWSGGQVDIAERGYVLLEGFRNDEIAPG